MADAVITWISGPVLRARTSRELRVSEAIIVGTNRLLGEVIRLDGEDIVAQIYDCLLYTSDAADDLLQV